MPFADLPPLLPLPQLVKPLPVEFRLDERTSIAADRAFTEVAEQAREMLRPATGFSLPFRSQGSKRIAFRTLRKRKAFSPEGYVLNVSANEIRIEATSAAGALYGLQTLRQLLPSDIYRRSPLPGRAWIVPGVQIEDQPAFGWRGAMLDVARHFMPKASILKFIDAMAVHKLNSLHLHLTDDQGWRIEIKRYPKLTSVGSVRAQTMAGHYRDQKFDGKPHGGFYTQDDLREIVAYAKRRFINVVPEIEMPGHAQAAVAAYPELGNTNEKLKVGEVWGVIENVFNPEESTVQFLKNVLDEVMEIFPSKFIHVGGDECPKTQWHKSARAQELIKARGLKNEEELQSWFIRQMDSYLDGKGRRLIGWDEILEGGLAPGATVMSWRGEAGGIAAAKSGHDVVMAPTTYTYFDYYPTRDTAKEPIGIGGYLPLKTVYNYSPIPKELSGESAKKVLGAQFQLWSEYIPNPQHLEYMAFPRGCALAEAVWSTAPKDYDGFMKRLSIHLDRLRAMGLGFRPID